ncbi:MAG: hypothetical protein LBT40_02670 [Deltaproteobacteria bacterium]|jgi:hypothetical protein|nr:hypothetical protein [Deltaproteobacteria bacterium]
MKYLQEIDHSGKVERGRLAPDASAEAKSKETWFSKHQRELAIASFISVPVVFLGCIFAMIHTQFTIVNTQFAAVKSDIRSGNADIRSINADIRADIRSINADIRSLSKDIADMRVDVGRLILVTCTPASANAAREQPQPPDVLADASHPGQSAPLASGPAEPVTQ